MSTIITSVWDLAGQFMTNPKFVTLNEEGIRKTAERIKEWKESVGPELWGLPNCIQGDDSNSKMVEKLFIYELITNSVNYCYWYGRSDIRPNGADSTKMYRLLDESFDYLTELKKKAQYSSHHELEIIIGTFIEKLSRERFPLLDHRVRHLKELLDRSDLLSVIALSVERNNYDLNEWLDYLVTSFPGFGKDMFLKRAFLFIMQLYRRAGLFKDQIHLLPVPADYQVPKMLRWMRCIEYHEHVSTFVDNGIMLLEGSREECEIRAATIMACDRIASYVKCTCEEVDSYLWLNRKKCSDPFHLTVTSNY